MTWICVFTLQLCKTDDANLRFYITTVQDGWRKFAFLHYNCARRMTQICVFYITTVQDGWRKFAFLHYNCARRMMQICVFNTRLFSLHNTLNYAIHRAWLRMVLLTDVYRNLTSLWIKPRERAFKQFKSPILNVLFCFFSVGKYKTNVVNLCRTALKNNNLNSLVKIIKTGEAWSVTCTHL